MGHEALSCALKAFTVCDFVMTNTGPQLPLVYLARHGETAWTITGQHTGLTDLPLTERGERNARRLGDRLKGLAFVRVFTSPLQRASRTCELAGFGNVAGVDHDLVEWNYGDYEGKTPEEIETLRPGWDLFRDGCPGGETVADVAARVDRVIGRVRAVDGNVLLFSSGHFLHMLGARWLGLEPAAGRYFFLDTAALSIVGYHHGRNDPVIRLWNDCGHASELEQRGTTMPTSPGNSVQSQVGR
jgi:probable phosphoglycerate mutase